jgi:uncharacterized membrane protein YoaK (UPF0700 family)
MLALLLAGIAAAVDVLSYLGLGGVLTANMTGNTVLLGLALGRVETEAIAQSGAALVGFAAGVAAGALIVRQRDDEVWSPSVTAALALELLVLMGVTTTWALAGPSADLSARQLALIGLTALALGVQSAAA